MAKVSRHDIAQAALDLLHAGQPADKVAASLAGYLVSERRTRELDALVRDLETLRFRQDGVLEATVVSANEPNESIRKTIQDLMQAKHVHLHHQLNPDVVGGVRVHALDKQFDLSIRSKLKRLKNATKAA